MKFENTEAWGFEHAFRGLRNPKNSWNRSDSFDCTKSLAKLDGHCSEYCKRYRTNDCYMYGRNETVSYIIGDADLKLAQTLIRGGTEHRKFMRQIMISVDITAPLFWWKEFDTYKVGTTANSTSTMHKLATTPITIDCFETDDYDRTLNLGSDNEISTFEEDVIYVLENIRKKHLETKDKRYWKELIRWLPESWLQTRTVTMNYENLRNMYFQRKNHKLTEWSIVFIKWVESLPYAKELITYEPSKP